MITITSSAPAMAQPEKHNRALPSFFSKISRAIATGAVLLSANTSMSAANTHLSRLTFDLKGFEGQRCRVNPKTTPAQVACITGQVGPLRGSIINDPNNDDGSAVAQAATLAVDPYIPGNIAESLSNKTDFQPLNTTSLRDMAQNVVDSPDTVFVSVGQIGNTVVHATADKNQTLYEIAVSFNTLITFLEQEQFVPMNTHQEPDPHLASDGHKTAASSKTAAAIGLAVAGIVASGAF